MTDTTTTQDVRTITFTPSAPLKVGEKTYTALTLRKMKAKDRISADLVDGDHRKIFAIYSSMADVPIQVIEELDDDDFDRLEEEARPLVGKSLRDREAKQLELMKSVMTAAALEMAKQ